MRRSLRRGTLLAVAALTASAVQFTSPAVAAPAPAASPCGPLDVAFVLDDTGSMGGAITNLKTGINAIVNDVVTASGGDYRLGLVTFKDNITVHNTLAPGNAAAVTGYVTNTLAASAGGSEPEASDEALNTVVNNLPAAGRPQNVDFGGVWRSNAMKFVVLVTDARPGGFDNVHAAADVANAAQRANDALGKGIKISPVYVPTSATYTPVITPIMQNYASTTGGVFTQTTATGAGTADAIRKLLSDCRQTDVVIRDQVTDTGAEPNPNGTVWNSPDIKVCPTTADCAGIQPVVGATNFIHVRLNNATAASTGTLKVYRTPAGGGTTWNNATNGSWVYIGQQSLTVPTGGTVAKIPWTGIPGPGHFCLLARWVSATDPMTFAEGSNTAQNTRNNNNIAWKNLQTVRGKVFQPVRSWFTLGNATEREVKTDLVLTGEKPVAGTVVIDLGPRLFERWRAGGGQAEGVKQVGETALQLDPRRAALLGVPLLPGEAFTAELVFTPGAPGEYLTNLVQFVEGEDHGGVAYQVITDRE
ncbi:vWA domain-containing protein [Saccharothrix sp. NRRL B-16348]|uniref:vWA domain-containing protein n=1 Tax=Saccharothrix sp. NRRL B-16348 TaxID=1415542 RepID=UPI0006AE9E62|nr:vWA domain-containing protein [Saccharothrix sp. NRRL B-16348]